MRNTNSCPVDAKAFFVTHHLRYYCIKYTANKPISEMLENKTFKVRKHYAESILHNIKYFHYFHLYECTQKENSIHP